MSDTLIEPLVEPSEATDEQWARAGASAAAWFREGAEAMSKCRTAERRELENELLDGALADAGIIEHELATRIEQYSVRV